MDINDYKKLPQMKERIKKLKIQAGKLETTKDNISESMYTSTKNKIMSELSKLEEEENIIRQNAEGSSLECKLAISGLKDELESIASKLEQLETLKTNGAIGDEEYNNKYRDESKKKTGIGTTYQKKTSLL